MTWQRSLYLTEGGGAPRILRPESSKDPTTAIISGAVRRSETAPDGPDIEDQSRIFFAAKDAKKGREVFLSAGTSKTNKLVKDIETASKVGSDPEQFCVAGPNNSTQRVFFVAKSPDDLDTFQIWTIGNPTPDSRGRPVYDAAPFTTGLFALADKPQNLIASDSDVFFTAPPPGGGTPVLWHLPANGRPNDLEYYSGAVNPQNLTLPTKGPSYQFLTFSAEDNGKRYFARWAAGVGTGGNGGTITLLKRAALDVADSINPVKITNAVTNNFSPPPTKGMQRCICSAKARAEPIRSIQF